MSTFGLELSAEGQARFDAVVTRRVLSDRQVVLREGDACASLLFVESGALRVFKAAESGREITLYRVRPGELCILSLSSLLASTPYTASVSADGRTVARELDAASFRALYEREPKLQRLVALHLHRLLAEVMELVSEVAFRRVDERLAAYLRDASSREPVVHTTHERLALELGTSREVVSRLLENLRDDGVVKLERGAVSVLARERLGPT